MMMMMQMSVGEAKQVCPYAWMKEALDELVNRLTQQQKQTSQLEFWMANNEDYNTNHREE